MDQNKLIRCAVCGTENEIKNQFCDGCGAKLSAPSTQKKDSNDLREDKSKNTSGKKKESEKNVNKKKAIDTTKLSYVVVILVVIGGAILYFSGAFDQPTVSKVNQVPHDEFHRGADLSQLQEINRLRDLVTNNPGDHQSLLHLAHLLNDSGFKPEAIKWYKQYLADHGDEADVWVDMGVCYFDMNDFDNAVKAMKKGIELEPKHQIAHFNLGIVNYTKGSLNEAVSWWNKAIEINPSNDIASKARELIKTNTKM